MSKQVIIHLPVADVAKSRAFFEGIGFSLNRDCSGEHSACLAFSDTIHVMLSAHEQFKQFSPKPICDTSKALEVLLCLQCESRAEVDDMATKAEAAGATDAETTDYGFMYQRSFIDLDGHGWALNFMSEEPAQS